VFRDEESYDWDYGDHGGMDWTGLQLFFADETDDLEATLQYIDEPLKPSLSSLSNTGVFTLCLRGRGCAACIENRDSSSIIPLPPPLRPARVIAAYTAIGTRWHPVVVLAHL
jgi:hypothetical protein